MQIHSVSAVAVADCSRMRGAPDVLPTIHELSMLASELQLMLHFVWHPRTAAPARLADALSKHQHTSDWALFTHVYAETGLRSLHTDARTQVLDCVASEAYFAEL